MGTKQNLGTGTTLKKRRINHSNGAALNNRDERNPINNSN